MQKFDVIILGQGYAGLKAAKLAADKGLKVATVEAMFPGGLVMSINELHSGPEGESDCGPDLTGGLALENMDTCALNVSGEVESVKKVAAAWQVEAGGETLSAPNLVIATGARLRKLGVPGEAEFEGRGVSACADCDGPIFMGKEGVIVGGGDAAFQEAVALAAYASKVTIVMRGAAPRARADLVEAALANPAISLLANTHIEEIIGSSDGVTAVKIGNGEGTSRELPCSVLFAFVGQEPASEFLPAEIARDANAAVVTDTDLRTSVPGVWAIGAVRAGFGGKLSDASADAEKLVAALA